MKIPELLSPAGDSKVFIAAINAGCDAVYFGIEGHGARASAKNISFDELEELADYAHLRGVSLYATFNILYSDNEIEYVVKDIIKAYNMGVDAVIVQDLGLFKVLKRDYPCIEVHISTQMSIYNYYGARFVKKMDAQRVVMARETELSEYKYISDNIDIDTECFAHGALCVCLSGQCLMSSMIGKRSGNRGECAQPCRKKYKVIRQRDNKNMGEGYILSPFDLNTISNIDEYIENKVTSIKLEGRLKSRDYVALVTNGYRKALDKRLEDVDISSVAQIFNRGFTKGINRGDFGKTYLTGAQPSHIGVEVGRVIFRKSGITSIKFNDAVFKNDSLAYLLKNGERKGFKLDRDYKKSTVGYFKITEILENNSPVYRSSSVDTNRYAEVVMREGYNKIPIDVELNIKTEKPLEAKINCGVFTHEYTGNVMAEKSVGRPLTRKCVEESFDKLKSTGFYIDNFKVHLDDDSFLSKASINSVRRDLIEGISCKITDSFKRNLKYKCIQNENFIPSKIKKSLSLSVDSVDDVLGIDLSSVNRIYGDFSDSDIYKLKRDDNFELVFDPGPLFTRKDLEIAKIKMESKNYDAVYINDLSSLEYFKSEGYKVYAGYGLNITNNYSLSVLEKMGVDGACLSYEMSEKLINNIRSGMDVELNVFGRIPVMVTKSCPASYIRNCKDNRKCYECAFRRGHEIEDDKRYRFVFERINDFTIIYNSKLLMIDKSLKSLVGVDIFRLDLRGVVHKKEIILFYSDMLKGNAVKKDIKLIGEFSEFTRGHFFESTFEV